MYNKARIFYVWFKIDGAAIIRQQKLVPTGKLNVLQQQHAWHWHWHWQHRLVRPVSMIELSRVDELVLVLLHNHMTFPSPRLQLLDKYEPLHVLHTQVVNRDSFILYHFLLQEKNAFLAWYSASLPNHFLCLVKAIENKFNVCHINKCHIWFGLRYTFIAYCICLSYDY